ncbi:MAG: tetraacyldisaccharide 4'-kinase [Hyphomicrobiaceae bacterium]
MARLLSPISVVWGAVSVHRFRTGAAFQAALPVVCIGNLTAGGTGKTPMALLVADILRRLGKAPVFLSRGYGGRLRGPHWVEPDRDLARDVGDEPLLLARSAPVVICADRAAGARAISERMGPSAVVVMDDGLQNGSLAKDIVIAVVDGRRGVGNGLVMPAGPLRAPLAFQLGLVDAVIVNTPLGAGSGDAAPMPALRHLAPLGDRGLVLAATTSPVGDTSWLREKPILAYSGIGAPERFFDLLEHLGATLVARQAFPDHHAFTPGEARALLAMARDKGAVLCTTAKDLVRLGGNDADMTTLRAVSRVLPVRTGLAPSDLVQLEHLIEGLLAARAAVRT